MRKLEQYQPEKRKKGEQTGLISVIVTVYNIRVPNIVNFDTLDAVDRFLIDQIIMPNKCL